MTAQPSNNVGPVLDTTGALKAAQASLAALRASQCYKQYKANGSLASTKLGECERQLLLVAKDLGG